MIYALTKKDALHAVAVLFCAQTFNFQHKRLHAVLKRRADDVDQHKRLHAAGLALLLYVRTESMKRRADDGRTIHKIYIYTYIHIPYIARIAVPFMWGSLRLAPIT